MSVTDELREWAKMLTHWWYDPVKDEYTYTTGTMPPSIDAVRLDSNIIAIADRIDAEHEAKVSYWQGASYRDGYDEGFASADDWLAQHEGAMAEHGWVKLPVSEDGDVLHIGELVDEKLPFGGYAAPAPIDTMELSRGASGYVWMVKLDAENRALISPKLLRHHHEPTVEDVLREFGRGWHEQMNGQETFDIADYVERYAAKLRLAGEDA